MILCICCIDKVSMWEIYICNDACLTKVTRNYSAPFYCDKHMGESQTVILLLPSDNVLHEMFPNNAREGIFKNMSPENTIVKIFKRMRKRALIFNYQPTCASTFHSVS